MGKSDDLSRPWDRCDTCRSATLERVPGADHYLCGHATVLSSFRRARVSAAVARAEVCGGRLHPKFREAA